jgi:hypothetical protein
MTDLNLPSHLLRRAPDNNDFKAKLNEEERCSILALHMAGVRTDVLALAYDLNRRTVTSIVNETSRHYKPARAMRKKLGDPAFIEKYATEEARKRVLSVSTRPEVRDSKPDARERRKAGINVVKPEQCAYSHRLDVQFKGDMDPPGWYYRDMDSKSTPDTWFHNGEASLASSQNCLAMAEANLTDD